MKLSRKRRRELRHLRSDAQELLDQQLHVLGNANTVLRQAGHTAKNLSDEYVAPRVDEAVDRVRPTVDRGVASARRASAAVRRVTTPFVANALASTIRALDEIENPRASAQVRGFGERTGLLKPAKKKSKAGGIVALGLGIAAAAGVGYALWQAFRTDDELWIAPEGE
ncbi:MAG: DNA/RNA helicase [Leucobacter sp.]